MISGKNDSLSNIEIAVFALFILGGWQTRIHTEDIAIKCFELAPSKFSWVKYKQFPDLMTTWYALGDAEKTKNGRLVIGESERKKSKSQMGGWRLSEEGIKWIDMNKDRVESSLKKTTTPNNRLQEDRRLKVLIKSEGFTKFLKNGEQADISYTGFVESIVCTVNTEKHIVSERLEQLYSVGTVLRQEQVLNYLNFCRSKFLSKS
jgi:hypothetical protein